MSTFEGLNLSDLPHFDLGLANSARHTTEMEQSLKAISKHNAR